MTAESETFDDLITVGTFDDYDAAMRAWFEASEHGKDGYMYSCTNVAPFVVTARRMSDAESRSLEAEVIAHDACKAFGARFEYMPLRIQHRAEGGAELAAWASLEARPGDCDRAFRKARRAAVQVVRRQRGWASRTYTHTRPNSLRATLKSRLKSRRRCWLAAPRGRLMGPSDGRGAKLRGTPRRGRGSSLCLGSLPSG